MFQDNASRYVRIDYKLCLEYYFDSALYFFDGKKEHRLINDSFAFTIGENLYTRVHCINEYMGDDFANELFNSASQEFYEKTGKIFELSECINYDMLYNKKIIDEKEYDLLREAYRDTNDIITRICFFIVDIGMCELWSTPDGYSATTLEKLQELIDFVTKNNLPLPDIEPFKQYEYDPKEIDDDSRGWGYSFDGKQYSKFLNM